MTEREKLMGWRDIPAGAVVDAPGSAAGYLTGGWRSQRPVFRMDHCTGCGVCYLFCPDAAIVMIKVEPRSKKLPEYLPEVLLDYCKGCGICARECYMATFGRSCFQMMDEEEFR